MRAATLSRGNCWSELNRASASGSSGTPCVDGEHRPGNAIRLVTQKKFHRVSHVVDIHKSIKRTALRNSLQLLTCDSVGHVCGNKPGSDSIHINSRAANLPGKRSRETDHRRLACRVDGKPGVACRSYDRRYINDSPTSVCHHG